VEASVNDEFNDAVGRHPSAGGERSGDRRERGRRAAIGVDLSRLVQRDDFRPVVEYLTAIQTMRGDGGSLLFVRGDDLDAMAEQDGRPVPEFLDRLDQLGVVVSSN
jgi:hypothetical protein